MNLVDCLRVTPRHILLAICRAHNLSRSSSLPKEALITRLNRALMKLSTGPRFNALGHEEKCALQRLAARDGRMPLHDFTRAFGPIRPYRPWRRTQSSQGAGPAHPWRDPISTTERLLYKGLIYLTPSDPQHRQPREVILPGEFLDLLTGDDSPTAAQPTLSDAHTCATPSDPLLDLALFLAYLQSANVRPLHGRWLSPGHLRALGPCLSPPQPCHDARSELQAGRIPFIHYLCESLGFTVITGDCLKPSPTTMAWLARPHSTQLQALWETWLAPTDENRALWTRYRLPGHHLRDPVGFTHRLTRLLATFPAGAWLPLSELVRSPHLALDELIPWWEREEGQPVQDLLHEILAGPLSWLGVVAHQRGAAPEQRRWRLTDPGARLLGRVEAACLQDDTQPLTLTEDLTLTLPSRPGLAGLLALAEWVELAPGPQLHLTPSSLAGALERGATIEDLFALLSRYATPLLTPAQRVTLQAWAQEAAPVTLRPCVVLETANQRQMAELWTQRGIRPHLGRQLTPRLATLGTPDPDHFIRTLRRNGLSVQSLLPNGNHSAARSALGPGDAFWLAVAFLVHSHLARRLSLTSVPPAAVLERVCEHLGPAAPAAAQAAAAEAIARLDQALDGPAPLEPTMAPDALLRRLEVAIQDREVLQIRYWSAWRGEITERRVQPQCIEWRGDRVYLTAYCHLRRAQRTFRLDRILEVTGCETSPGASPAPDP